MREKYIEWAKKACQYVQDHCPLGSSNRCNGASDAAQALAEHALREQKKDFYVSISIILGGAGSEDDKHFKIIELLAQIAIDARAGKCQEMAALAFLFLMRANIGPLELVSIPTHTFLVIGRNQDTPIEDPRSWNKEAIVCDPWRRKLKCSASGFFFKESVVYSSERLFEKLGEEACSQIKIGYAFSGPARGVEDEEEKHGAMMAA
jgi:hypothetical protein